MATTKNKTPKKTVKKFQELSVDEVRALLSEPIFTGTTLVKIQEMLSSRLIHKDAEPIIAEIDLMLQGWLRRSYEESVNEDVDPV